jgi:hypothetical protein
MHPVDRGREIRFTSATHLPSGEERRRPKLSGDSIEEAIPDPISNSEVKLFGADGTAWGICVGE